MRLAIALLLLYAAVAFGLGISLPIVSFERLFIFEETPSLLQLASGLWQQGSIAVALAVVAFSILFPVVKMAITFAAAFAPRGDGAREPSVLERVAPALAKWSMMDVLLVALVIFAAKSSGLANAFALPGLWFYASSAVAGAIGSTLLKRLEAQDGRQLPGL